MTTGQRSRSCASQGPECQTRQLYHWGGAAFSSNCQSGCACEGSWSLPALHAAGSDSPRRLQQQQVNAALETAAELHVGVSWNNPREGCWIGPLRWLLVSVIVVAQDNLTRVDVYNQKQALVLLLAEKVFRGVQPAIWLPLFGGHPNMPLWLLRHSAQAHHLLCME